MNAIPRPLIFAFVALALFNIVRGLSAPGPKTAALAHAGSTQHTTRTATRHPRQLRVAVAAQLAPARVAAASMPRPYYSSDAAALPVIEDDGQRLDLVSPQGTHFRPR